MLILRRYFKNYPLDVLVGLDDDVNYLLLRNEHVDCTFYHYGIVTTGFVYASPKHFVAFLTRYRMKGGRCYLRMETTNDFQTLVEIASALGKFHGFDEMASELSELFLMQTLRLGNNDQAIKSVAARLGHIPDLMNGLFIILVAYLRLDLDGSLANKRNKLNRWFGGSFIQHVTSATLARFLKEEYLIGDREHGRPIADEEGWDYEAFLYAKYWFLRSFTEEIPYIPWKQDYDQLLKERGLNAYRIPYGLNFILIRQILRELEDGELGILMPKKQLSKSHPQSLFWSPTNVDNSTMEIVIEG